MKLLPFLLALLLPLSAFAADPVAIERDVEYGRAGDVSLKLDVFRPAKTDPAEKNETERKEEAKIKKLRPAVIYVHGGAWKYGDKIEGVPFLSFLAASGDYVGFSINYRLADGSIRWPDPLFDCKAAVRFVRANAKRFGVDPDRIGVAGTSAGGHLVNMLGVTCDRPEFEGSSGTPGVSTRVRCVINNCGPTDLPNLGFTDPKDWEILKGLLGATPSENLKIYKAASPIYYVEKWKVPGGEWSEKKSDVGWAPPTNSPEKPKSENTAHSPLSTVHSSLPPFLHLHGTKDPIVNYESQAVAFDRALKKSGASSILIAVTGGGHPAISPTLAPRTRAFLDKHLLDKPVEVSEEAVEVGK